MTFWWRRWHEQSRTPRRPRLTLAVGDQLHLDVVRVADHRLHEDGAVAERVLRPRGGSVSASSSSPSSATLRMPRPPPPAAALIISG